MSEEPQGRFHGIPYDWRRPTRARIKSRIWNDEDARIFTPRAFGAGWDINVAHLLRRLGLRR
jgi:hypothetical protein